jgi:hypothetical protein
MTQEQKVIRAKVTWHPKFLEHAWGATGTQDEQTGTTHHFWYLKICGT